MSLDVVILRQIDSNVNAFSRQTTLSARIAICSEIPGFPRVAPSVNGLARNAAHDNASGAVVVKIGDFGLVKLPESTMTSMYTELKGSLNDPDLIHVGFANYEMCHETYAITRLCYFILTGRTNIEKQKEGAIKRFWNKGTSTDRSVRFTSVDEIMQAVRAITEGNK